MKLLRLSLVITFIFFISSSFSQKNVVRDIKSFGAKGDGKTNDQEAFEKAATYFNKRGGNGKLIISGGIYIVGSQAFAGGKPNKVAYEGRDVLHFIKIKNFQITGTANSIIRYKDSLRFGAFNPATGEPYEHGSNLFTNYSYAAFIGRCIFIDSCDKISVSNLTLDGNNKGIITGGVWGDVGRQLPHAGIYVVNSKNILVNKMSAHYFGLDGIYVSNKSSSEPDRIVIQNSSFEYNSRQGFSWVGGNDVTVKNCKFNHTGRSAFASPPSAGVDIEAEVGPVANGDFTGCEFVDNMGVGLLAGSGNDSNCSFVNCTFWGATNWSIWVTKPRFNFTKCNIYGSTVHGYNSPDAENATKFNNCLFEDKSYRGKEPYGNFLVESNGARRISYTDCNFIANTKKLCWIVLDPKSTTEEKNQFRNCSFVIKGAAYPVNSYMAVMRGMAMKSCTFQFNHPEAKNKQYFFEGYTRGYNSNVDLGGNKIIYPGGNN